MKQWRIADRSESQSPNQQSFATDRLPEVLKLMNANLEGIVGFDVEKVFEARK